jgi:hypothetical protein
VNRNNLHRPTEGESVTAYVTLLSRLYINYADIGSDSVLKTTFTDPKNLVRKDASR